jgi:hypothetical protein
VGFSSRPPAARGTRASEASGPNSARALHSCQKLLLRPNSARALRVAWVSALAAVYSSRYWLWDAVRREARALGSGAATPCGEAAQGQCRRVSRQGGPISPSQARAVPQGFQARRPDQPKPGKGSAAGWISLSPQLNLGPSAYLQPASLGGSLSVQGGGLRRPLVSRSALGGPSLAAAFLGGESSRSGTSAKWKRKLIAVAGGVESGSMIPAPLLWPPTLARAALAHESAEDSRPLRLL